ncbi:hypothetical protein L7F22_046628 [Adiantum nelumboides]|nr:hypothetical protein [Adiantum nelumboides]
MPEEHSSSNGHICSPKQHHAVVVPWPGQGHINPLLHLSRTLASLHGFSITFVTLDYTHRLLLKSLQNELAPELQASKPAAAAKLDIKFVGVPSGIPAAASYTGDVPVLCAGLHHSAPAFERLVAELRPPPTCIISDIFVEHTQDAANKLGIPRVAFWTQSSASFAAHLAAARACFQQWEEGKLIDNIAGAPPLRFKDLPSFLQPYKEPADFMFRFSVQPFTRLEEAEASSPAGIFQRSKLSNSDFNTTPGFWKEDYSCLKWLDAQQEGSVLYVSFGSIALLTEEELHEFALGLEATGFPVLWVLRPGLLEGGDTCHCLLALRSASKGACTSSIGLRSFTFLAHPSVGAFFTHAGWNSTLEGISQGKPLLGFPYFAEQMLNCRCVQDLWGNGLALERHGEGLLTRSLVESNVRTLMSDPKLRETVVVLRDGARRAVLGSDLRHFVEFLPSSTQTEAEEEDVVQAKDKVVVVVVATKIKVSSSINQMMHNGQTIVDVEIIEARGVKEVAKITKVLIQIMKTENVGVVEEQITLNVTIHQETRVVEDSKTIMHLLAEM